MGGLGSRLGLLLRLPARQRESGRVYVSNETGGDIAVIDLGAGTVVERIPVGKRPRGLKLSRDGKQLLVALSGSPIGGPGVDESKLPPADRGADGIGLVDLETRKLVRLFPSGQDPESLISRPTARLSTFPTRKLPRCRCSTWRAATSSRM